MIMDGRELFALINAVARAKGLPDMETVMEAREYLHKVFPKPRDRAAFIATCWKECSEELGMTGEEAVEWFRDGCVNGGDILC